MAGTLTDGDRPARADRRAAAAGDCGHTQRSPCSPLGNVARALTARRGEPLLNVTFFGVRGSTPCPCDANRRYGGNTVLRRSSRRPGDDPIVLDLGTGLRFSGEHLPTDGSFRGHRPRHPPALGPRAGPAVLRPDPDRRGRQLDIYGPPQDGGLAGRGVRPASCGRRSSRSTVEDLYGRDPLPRRVRLRRRRSATPRCGCARCPTSGATNGYRVEVGGAIVAYISDHQLPLDGSHQVTDAVLELCDGADLLIHDAQYTPDEFDAEVPLGPLHGRLRRARGAGGRRQAPGAVPPRPGARRRHASTRCWRTPGAAAERTGLCEVIAAYEGLTVSFGG